MENPANPNTDPMNFTFLDPNFDFFNGNFDPFMEILMTDFLVSPDVFHQEDSSSSSRSTFNSSEKIPHSTSPAASFSTPNLKSKTSIKEKKRKEKESKQSIAFRLQTSIDVLDDGYRWRKYGKKPIRGRQYPRHYHKCSHEGCSVKKKMEREDPSYVKITYEGMHNHESPSVVYCEAHDDDVASLMSQNTLVFSRFPPS